MNPLKAKILDRIREDGPITIGQYMQMALMDPEHGYYMRRDPLGAAGDFITAPEISQIFGELIGLFFVQAWEDRGRPNRFHLVELGPGRGTLMADMLRAAKIRPEFLNAAEVTLIEASPVLRAVQEKTLSVRAPVPTLPLSGGEVRIRWGKGLGELDGGPAFLIANEFLDALPAEQLVRSNDGWRARTIAAKGDTLAFALTDDLEHDDLGFPDAPKGSILEIGSEAVAAIRTIADRIVDLGGMALIIDYGHHKTALGDTFQAMKNHRYADPLAAPGEADLTFHVDFERLAATAIEAGAQVFGPTPQGSFLEHLGVRARAERLKHAVPQKAAEIDAALHRLTDPAAMGMLFKVMAITDRTMHYPDGFACSS